MKQIILILLAALIASQVMAGTTDNLLKIYAQLADRTILRGSLPELPATITSQIPKDKANAVIFIEDQLKVNRLDVVRDGTKFVMILPTGWENSPLAAALAKLPAPSAEVATTSGSTEAATTPGIPAGTINFQNIRLDSLLEIYSKLRGRTLVRPNSLPDVLINFRTQTPLTRNEVIHAFDVILLLNGIATIDDGDKFVKVVPAKSAERTR